MSEGKVKWFNESRGYDFIQQKDGSDIFVHHSAIQMEGYRTLKEGERVRFNVKTGMKGPAAEDVHRITA